MSPLHLVVKAFDEEEKRSLATVRSLLDFGANVNSVDENGHTPLHWAFYFHKTDTAGFHILVVTCLLCAFVKSCHMWCRQAVKQSSDVS